MSLLNTNLSERVLSSLAARHDTRQWERLMANLLKRLELDEGELEDAKRTYETLATKIATKLNVPTYDVDVFPQGSMRTQTTISPRGNAQFDLDIVVKLSGANFNAVDPERFFADFGAALEGNESITGAPTAKRRCWRLNYPGKPFYFDVTPALADGLGVTGAKLKVRDPDTKWSPSNPEEFADWFCERAAYRFPFQTVVQKGLVEARTTVQPLPEEDVEFDDILRCTVQLMKLHRDNMYWHASDVRKEAQPISVIIVTLATKAFEKIWQTRRNAFKSPIEVVLAILEEMPSQFENQNGVVWVANPKLPKENFADRWRHDAGARRQEFNTWFARLETDVEALLSQSESNANETKIRNVFGDFGVKAWKDSLPSTSVLTGLLASAPDRAKTNPTAPPKVGSSSTLG